MPPPPGRIGGPTPRSTVSTTGAGEHKDYSPKMRERLPEGWPGATSVVGRAGACDSSFAVLQVMQIPRLSSVRTIE